MIRLRIRESCEQGIKVDQVFRGEQLVGINDLKYDNVKFCQSIPSLELRNGIFQQNYDINDILLSNGVVVVTEGNIIQVNYFIDNIGQFAIECTEDNQISECYDDVQGFLHICSEGVWDNLEGKPKFALHEKPEVEK